jgi:hypothetical protein
MRKKYIYNGRTYIKYYSYDRWLGIFIGQWKETVLSKIINLLKKIKE